METTQRTPEEIAWLEARSAELCANGHIRQRRLDAAQARKEADLFMTQLRSEQSLMKLVGFLAVVVLLSIGLVMTALGPALWDMAQQHWHQAPGLLAVVAIPTARMPFVTSIRCQYCQEEIPVMPPTRFSVRLLSEMSGRCSCRQVDTAPAAVEIFRPLLQAAILQSKTCPSPNVAAQQAARRIAENGTEAQCREALRSLLERADRLIGAGVFEGRTGIYKELDDRIRTALQASSQEVR